MIKFYRERETGDYLSIVSDQFTIGRDGRRVYDAIATALAGNAFSLCSTGVSAAFLKNRCRRVRPEDVPPAYATRLKWN